MAGPASKVVVCQRNWSLNLSLMILVTSLVSRFIVWSAGVKTSMIVLPSADVSFAAPSDVSELQAATLASRPAAASAVSLRTDDAHYGVPF